MIPAGYRLAAEILVVVLALAGIFALGHRGGVTAEHLRMQVQVDGLQRQWDTERIALQEAAIQAHEALLVERRRVDTEHQEVIHDAIQKADAARADAVAARSVSERLRQHTAALAAACGSGAGDPGAAGAGAAAQGPGLLLADLLGRADKRAGKLAEYADQARIAGAACERAYDALSR